MAHILVADDSRVTRRTLSFVLEQADHQVSTAEDGLQALELLNSSAIDLIVADINMPNMDGVQLLHAVKESSRLSLIPIMMLTSLGMSTEQLELVTAGANNVLTKPVSSWELLDSVNRLLAEPQ